MDKIEPIRLFLDDTIKKIAANLATMKDSKGRNRYASGNTAQSIGQDTPLYEVTQDTKGIVIDIYMPYYYAFIDKGVNGLNKNQGSIYSFRKASPPPLKSIREFMMSRGIVPRKFNKTTGKFDGSRLPITEKRLNSLAYILGRSIKLNGIEGVPYYSSVINENWLTELSESVLNVYGAKVLEDITVNFVDRNPPPV